LDSGDSPVTSYQLYRDQGDLNTVFTPVASYTGSGLTHTLSVPGDLPTVGKIYSFKFRAGNAIGYSEFSDLLRVGLDDTVLAPASLTANVAATGPNYISIQWSAVPDANLPTLGYTVEMLIGNE